MGNISIANGIILLTSGSKEALDGYENIVGSLELDRSFPWIRPQMLNLCGDERPYYYRNPIVTFGATYKGLEEHSKISQLLLKFEYLLRQLDFDFAQLRLQTEYRGNFDFYWTAEKTHSEGKEGLIESEEWLFGCGHRDMWGNLIPPADGGLQYPIAFAPEIKNKFNSILPELNNLELGIKTYVGDWPSFEIEPGQRYDLELILVYLELCRVINWGYEHGKGLFLERLKKIKEVDTPYKNPYSSQSQE